ncbi:FG-GAP-like repeat-containing protein [Streptomyces sp. WAC08241]|uniref:FG-GAP-like repeat-containing protein n=1 Tax=Streptomyces sp. WAC08241 TaxID=2487421 RepID=UPI0021AF52F8|nr:FG-GAP-like repeat-containing protein [Streptomyces sp. WAC08241]
MKLNRIPTAVLAGGLTVLGLTAPTAQAAPAEPSPMTIVSWNICGEAGGVRGSEAFCPSRATLPENEVKVREIVSLIRAQKADAIVMQEVCGAPAGVPAVVDGVAQAEGYHQRRLKELLGPEGWSFDFAPVTRDTDASEGGRLYGSACRGELKGGRLGNLIAVKGGIAARASQDSLPQVTPDPDHRNLPVQCVAVTGRSTAVCNTHVIPGSTDPRIGQQIANVKDFVESFAARQGVARAAVGGDFNREAENSLMAPLTGAFENCVHGVTHHGWNGTGHTWHEFDHLFVTRPATGRAISSCDIDVSRMDTTENREGVAPNGFSDHAPVVVRLGDQPAPARVPGDLFGSDGRPDLVTVGTDGKLYVHPGDGAGGVGAPREIGNGGWAGASVSHRGDWTGDGREDLVARVGEQLRVYSGGLDGIPKSPVTVGTVAADAQVVGAGDVTGDGRPDLVVAAENKLWLYENDTAAAGKPAVKPRKEIGNGGWAPMTVTGPGDVTGDGRPDLLVRDTRDGVLYLYRGQSGGTFGARTEYGRNYTTANRPLIAGAGDADRDGKADMWTTTGDGALRFYEGEATGSDFTDGPSTQVSGSGWNTVTALG